MYLTYFWTYLSFQNHGILHIDQYTFINFIYVLLEIWFCIFWLFFNALLSSCLFFAFLPIFSYFANCWCVQGLVKFSFFTYMTIWTISNISSVNVIAYWSYCTFYTYVHHTYFANRFTCFEYYLAHSAYSAYSAFVHILQNTWIISDTCLFLFLFDFKKE